MSIQTKCSLLLYTTETHVGWSLAMSAGEFLQTNSLSDDEWSRRGRVRRGRGPRGRGLRFVRLFRWRFVARLRGVILSR